MSAAEKFDPRSLDLSMSAGSAVWLAQLSPSRHLQFIALQSMCLKKEGFRLNAAMVQRRIAELGGKPQHLDTIRRGLRAFEKAGAIVRGPVGDDNRFRVQITRGALRGHLRAINGGVSKSADSEKTAPISAPKTDTLTRSERPRGVDQAATQGDGSNCDPPKKGKTNSERETPLNPPRLRVVSNRGGDDLDRLLEAWSGTGRNPLTIATVRRALAKAQDGNQHLERSTIVDRMLDYARPECAEVVPPSMNEPISWVASRDLTEKPRMRRSFTFESTEPRKIATPEETAAAFARLREEGFDL